MIQISRDELNQIRTHARADYPDECCGVLIGTAGDGPRKVRRVEPVVNKRSGEAARRRFLITADDYRRFEQAARKARLEIIGFYHSHPDHPAMPSEYDREHALPWYSYVIVSVDGRGDSDVHSWLLADDRSRFDRESIVESS